MAKQSGTHQPLNWLDRLRMNAAIKHLRSRFHNVRVAAHKEIQAILSKRRGIKRRVQDRLLKPLARKVTPKPLHSRLGLGAASAPAKARKRGTATPLAPRVPEGGFRAPNGYNQTPAHLKQRAWDQKAGRQQPSEAARALTEQGQRHREAAQQAQRERHEDERQARARGNGQEDPGYLREPSADILRRAGLIKGPERADGNGQARSNPHHDEHQARQQQTRDEEKARRQVPGWARSRADAPSRERAPRTGRKWGGLHKRLATPAEAPDLTRMPADRVAGRTRSA